MSNPYCLLWYLYFQKIPTSTKFNKQRKHTPVTTRYILLGCSKLDRLGTETKCKPLFHQPCITSKQSDQYYHWICPGGNLKQTILFFFQAQNQVTNTTVHSSEHYQPQSTSATDKISKIVSHISTLPWGPYYTAVVTNNLKTHTSVTTALMISIYVCR